MNHNPRLHSRVVRFVPFYHRGNYPLRNRESLQAGLDKKQGYTRISS